MKTLFTFTVIACALCVIGNPKHATAQWPQATSHEPTVTIEVGGIAFDREGRSDSPLVGTDSFTNATVLSDEQATDLGSAAGVQGKIIFPFRKTHQTLELRGSFVGWDQDTSITNSDIASPLFLSGILQVSEPVLFDPAGSVVSSVLPPGVIDDDLMLETIPLTTAFDGTVSTLSLVWPGLPLSVFADGVSPPMLDDIFDIQSVSTRYESDFASVELMSRRNTRPGMTWLFGPRFISLEEESEISAIGVSPSRIFLPPGSIDPGTTQLATAGVRSDTRNTLIGLQVGLEYNFPVTRDVYFQVSGRAGAFYNSINVDRSVSALLPTVVAGATDFAPISRDNDSGEAWLAEINVRGYVDFIPNTLSGYAGYDLLFIDELALAPNQSVAGLPIDSSSELFARGFSFGLKMNY